MLLYSVLNILRRTNIKLLKFVTPEYINKITHLPPYDHPAPSGIFYRAELPPEPFPSNYFSRGGKNSLKPLSCQKKSPKLLIEFGTFFFLINKLHSCQLYFLLKLQHIFTEYTIGIHQILYGLAGMNNSSMVAASKMFAYRF
jgi:hypothetical protein